MKLNLQNIILVTILCFISIGFKVTAQQQNLIDNIENQDEKADGRSLNHVVVQGGGRSLLNSFLQGLHTGSYYAGNYIGYLISGLGHHRPIYPVHFNQPVIQSPFVGYPAYHHQHLYEFDPRYLDVQAGSEVHWPGFVGSYDSQPFIFSRNTEKISAPKGESFESSYNGKNQ
ncbi:uncharacterized protein LOC142330827 [Lycorma delicatula]|uniref:uncharacterized protein LOC142330827 n=1 Tax=Lycorma delicatula TaxID=130591 RepID=UPI003F513BEC